jgi:hypothetical protein
MRLVAAFALLLAFGCGNDNTSMDAGLPRCSPTLQQGGTCSPTQDTACVNGSGLMCTCECGHIWICGFDIACDMGPPPRDLTFAGD